MIRKLRTALALPFYGLALLIVTIAMPFFFAGMLVEGVPVRDRRDLVRAALGRSV